MRGRRAGRPGRRRRRLRHLRGRRRAHRERRGSAAELARRRFVSGMHVSRAYCRRGVVQPGGRHLAGSAQLSKGSVRALMLHAPRARRDLVQYNCVPVYVCMR